jgi:hypothetical protein
MNDKLSAIHYTARGYWRELTATKKLAADAKISEAEALSIVMRGLPLVISHAESISVGSSNRWIVRHGLLSFFALQIVDTNTAVKRVHQSTKQLFPSSLKTFANMVLCLSTSTAGSCNLIDKPAV